ncbi:MAG: chemotaxis protein CheW [Dehalococcoidia bacterium]|nr:chemotaxis protein CheW [Dehalococcoidia bacterium]
MPASNFSHLPRQLVVFRVGETAYGLDIDAVDEILPLLEITPIAGAPGGVVGIADVRKRVIPIFDLHWKFGIPTPTFDASTRLVLVEAGDGPVTLLVDDVAEVMSVSNENFQPVVTPGDTSGLGYLNGVFRVETGLLLWVDHNRLVPAGVAPTALMAA